MILGAITGVPTPACLSAASNPVEAVTPPLWELAPTLRWAFKELTPVYGNLYCGLRPTTRNCFPKSLQSSGIRKNSRRVHSGG